MGRARMENMSRYFVPHSASLVPCRTFYRPGSGAPNAQIVTKHRLFPVNSVMMWPDSNGNPSYHLQATLLHHLDRHGVLNRLLVQSQVEAADNRVGVVNRDRPHIGQRLDLGSTRGGAVSFGFAPSASGSTYTSLTWSSVMTRPSCPTRVLTAFQPVRREAKCT